MFKFESHNNVTVTKYFTVNRGPESQIKRVLKAGLQIINRGLDAMFKLKIVYQNRLLTSCDANGLEADLIQISNHRLALHLTAYFNELDIQLEEIEVRRQIEQFRKIYENRPAKDLEGGFGFNNLLMLYLIIKNFSPQSVIESGVWRGNTSYIIDKSNENKMDVYSHDINLRNNRYNSKRVKHYEYDVTNNKELKEASISLAFFDDHVSHYDRALFCAERDIGVVILDDDVGITNIHSDAWPPIPTMKMLSEYSCIPHKFSWQTNGLGAKADISNLNPDTIFEYYNYFQLPDLFEYTGFRDTPCALLIKR